MTSSFSANPALGLAHAGQTCAFMRTPPPSTTKKKGGIRTWQNTRKTRQTGTYEGAKCSILVSWTVKQHKACSTPIGAFLWGQGAQQQPWAGQNLRSR